MFQALAPDSDEGLALETSALNVSGHSFIINLVDPTKLPHKDLPVLRIIHSKKLAWNSDSVICILHFFFKSKLI